MESDSFENNHITHALAIGGASGALLKVMGSQTNTSIIAGAVCFAGSYSYMLKYGHGLPMDEPDTSRANNNSANCHN
jgi:hypothetical protein